MIFLASYPKSGSTWVRALISAWYGSNDINNLVGSVSDNESYYLRLVSARDDLGFERRLLLRPAQYMAMEALPYRPLVIKTHTVNSDLMLEGGGSIPTIPPFLPKGAVYIVRDPRDVAISYAHHMGISIDEAIDQMDNDDTGLLDADGHRDAWIGSWSGHVASWLRPDVGFPVLIVRYEDLKKDAVGVFTTLCKSFKWDTSKVQAAVDACEFSKLKAQEEKSGFKEQSDHNNSFFRSGKSGGWKEILTPEQNARIIAGHGEIMEQLGYE